MATAAAVVADVVVGTAIITVFCFAFCNDEAKTRANRATCYRIDTVSYVCSGSIKSKWFFPVRLYAKRHVYHDTKGPHTGAASSHVASVVA